MISKAITTTTTTTTTTTLNTRLQNPLPNSMLKKKEFQFLSMMNNTKTKIIKGEEKTHKRQR